MASFITYIIGLVTSHKIFFY